MIAEAGLAALWLAAALALLQLGAAIAGPRVGDVRAVAVPTAVAQGVLTLFAFAMLIWLFVRTDLSVELVAANSHSMKPFIYRFSGAWGNHEGSMLLWVTVLAVAGAGLALVERRLPPETMRATLGAQAALALGFFGFLLIASNPFARLYPAPAEGQGLNPLLQDPGLAFHPPTLYLGYVGLSVAFSLAVGALITREVGPALARAMRPWVLGAWVLLTLGITAGSYWAYYELGWGGWWFWDPVENASLMPWLAATALLHSVNVLAARGGLRSWTIMLAVVAFSMSMVGTFLVRSGILTSVHSFAVDPERGSFILGLLVLYVGGALALFAARVGTVREGARFELVSREGALVANNLLLTVLLGVVFVGTLYPIFVEAATGDKISVGPPYFNAVSGPITLVLALLLFIGPLLNWRRDRRPNLRRIALPLVVTVLALAATFLADMSLLARLGLAFAAGLAVASLLPLAGRNLRRTPLATWGMVISHLGVAVALAGAASDTAFTRETLAAARPGEVLSVGPWSVRLAGVDPVAGPNWTAVEGHLVATRGGTTIRLDPQSRTFSDPPTETSEAAIRTLFDGQLYTVLGHREGERWQLRLWWKPFVTLIWLGGALIALGGALALVGRWWRGRRQRRSEEAFA
ncbi:heme lyase CcmF/NrfE family subunit [Sphingomonas sp. BN140010]|uniref:Heme lyase CcmF/NrfE family subunit n=1 Tax=Sphingomonas arvum TaxID=2992113 RepID=A0ABT3JD58_9SPHN|nr:heme lyase CcmF/NrfE family subunit [Sphingomonas sp. BN140010]MCW3797000.1 heme lyase CcmF/NrfE family subunit [Sphingomonas sp. BN140010]